MDGIHSVPSADVQRFLNKCLNRQQCALDLNELQRPMTGDGQDSLQHVDRAIEQNLQAIFQLRFAKVAWYRSYKQYVDAQGWLRSDSHDNFDVLLPQDLRFGVFVKGIHPNPSGQMRERIHKLALAGFRYDYLCRDENMLPDQTGNEGYTFLLPESISAQQWEHDMLDIELQQTRRYLHGLDHKRVADSFSSGSLHELARWIINHYMLLIKPPQPPPLPREELFVGQSELANAVAIPSNRFAHSQDGAPSSNRNRPSSSKISTITTRDYQPQYQPQLGAHYEQGVAYAQQLNGNSLSNQHQSFIIPKRGRSPAPTVPLPNLILGSNQATGHGEMERPVKSPRMMIDSTVTPILPGRPQQRSVNYSQQQQRWQQGLLDKSRPIQQQSPAGQSTFADGRTPSFGGPVTTWSWPAGYRHSEATLADKVTSPGTPAAAWSSRLELKPSEPSGSRRREIVGQLNNISNPVSQSRRSGARFVPPLLSHPDPKSPDTHPSVAKNRRRKSMPFSDGEQLQFLLQQEPTQQHRFSQSTFWDFPSLNIGPSNSTQSAVWAQATPPTPSFRNPEQQQQQQQVSERTRHLHTDQALSTTRPQQIVSAQNASLPQTLPPLMSSVQPQRQERTFDRSSPRTEQMIRPEFGLWPQRAPPSFSKNIAQPSPESEKLVQNESVTPVKGTRRNTLTIDKVPLSQTPPDSTKQQLNPDRIANMNRSYAVTKTSPDEPPVPVLSAAVPTTYIPPPVPGFSAVATTTYPPPPIPVLSTAVPTTYQPPPPPV
ncbi:MAG: hypothetical protein Q9224_002519, partial [Gallowayella concinna]